MAKQLELPSYKVKPSEDFPGWVIVVCPREDCGGTFLVKKSLWAKPRKHNDYVGREYTVTGRACPYCFRANRIPARLRNRYNTGS